MRPLFEKEGYSIVSYVSALDFLASSWRRQNSCIVSNVDMPALGGVELLTYFQLMKISAGVIIFGERGNTHIVLESMGLVGFEFLTHPVNFDALLDAVRAALTRENISLLHFRATGAQDLYMSSQ
ncbi:FixJ family two-component response regulator [Rhodoblastus sphagnicola]|nr:response regulator [Rhodoblastus sphagnicola]MBB4198936.1 FixJ family two-component response regulator [Rhodoblastus sphagnicola]